MLQVRILIQIVSKQASNLFNRGGRRGMTGSGVVTLERGWVYNEEAG